MENFYTLSFKEGYLSEQELREAVKSGALSMAAYKRIVGKTFKKEADAR